MVISVMISIPHLPATKNISFAPDSASPTIYSEKSLFNIPSLVSIDTFVKCSCHKNGLP